MTPIERAARALKPEAWSEAAMQQSGDVAEYWQFQRDQAIAHVKIVASALSEWQPIETAPRDGTLVIVYTEDGRREIASWVGEFWFNGDVTEAYFGKPTHWMPLPAPPEAS